VSRSYYRAFRYHFGSLAFGAFLLAVVRTIQVVLYYIQKQVEKGGNNKVVLAIIKCLQCYVACFERFIEFLNKNAYIQIALQGKSFCTAAKDAFSLIMSNMARFSIVGGIGNIFQAIGVVIIAFGGCAFTYCMSVYYTALATQVYSPIIPTVATGIVCSLIGLLFMIVYGMSIDTILQCFLLDETLAKASG
jgi:hypothetical protein